MRCAKCQMDTRLTWKRVVVSRDFGGGARARRRGAHQSGTSLYTQRYTTGPDPTLLYAHCCHVPANIEHRCHDRCTALQLQGQVGFQNCRIRLTRDWRLRAHRAVPPFWRATRWMVPAARRTEWWSVRVVLEAYTALAARSCALDFTIVTVCPCMSYTMCMPDSPVVHTLVWLRATRWFMAFLTLCIATCQLHAHRGIFRLRSSARSDLGSHS